MKNAGHSIARAFCVQTDANLKNFSGNPVVSTCLVSGYRGHAQERTTVTVNMTDVTLNEVITELKKQTKYDFFITASW